MKKSSSDRREHFNDVFDFDVAFKKGFDFQGFTSAYRKGKKLIFELGNYFFNFLANGKVLVERVGELSENMPVFFRRWEIDFPDGKVVGGSVGGDSGG